MGAHTFGTHFQVLTFGESHGPAMGAVIEGCPAGVAFSHELILEKMRRRRPGYFPWVSSRKEADKPELLSGVFEGRTLNTPIAFLIRNQDTKPQDYQNIKTTPRPGHADDLWKEKFGHADHRGGGRASGRETTGRVVGGAVAEMFLTQLYPQLNVQALPTHIGPFVRKDKPPDNSRPTVQEGTRSKLKENSVSLAEDWFGAETKKVENFLIQKKKEGLSYGGIMELYIKNPPKGLGQPVFRKLKSDLSSAFMSIGACYAVSLGGKDDIHSVEGSLLHGQNKPLVYGGIRGGISTGEDIVFQLKFKPPASVLNVAKKGRHDPCLVPRALVVAEAMAWLTIADHVLWMRKDHL